MRHNIEPDSQINVAFSWEKKPGISKAKHHHHILHRGTASSDDSNSKKLLPPPPSPCFSKFRVLLHQYDPPLNLKVPSKNYFYKVIGFGYACKQEEDPFLVAFNKCTKSNENHAKNVGRLKTMSCKYSCSVASDNLVSMSQIPGSIMKLGRQVERLKGSSLC